MNTTTMVLRLAVIVDFVLSLVGAYTIIIGAKIIARALRLEP